MALATIVNNLIIRAFLFKLLKNRCLQTFAHKQNAALKVKICRPQASFETKIYILKTEKI